MMRMDVQFDIRAARASMKGLEKEVNKGAGRALTRTAIAARKVGSEQIRQRLSLKAATVNKALVVKDPYRGALIRDVVAKGSPLPLKSFSANQTRRGVTFRISRGSGRKVYRRLGRPGFINPNWGGENVFVRTMDDPPGPQEAKIKKVFGPGIAQAFVAGGTMKPMMARAREMWAKTFAHEMLRRRKSVP